MNASASLGAVRRSGVSGDPVPVVLVDGVPEPRLAVESYNATGPLDIRSARLLVDAPGDVPGVMERWPGAEVSIAMPLRLSDAATTWPILMRGVLKHIDREEAAETSEQHLQLADAWEDLLARPMETIGWRNPDGALVDHATGRLEAGADANRSENTCAINGRPVRVIQPGSGLAWTVAEALATIGAFAGFDLSLHGLPREVASAELMQAIDLGKPLRLALESILQTYDLLIQRDLSRVEGVIVERRAVRPQGSGRLIRVVWADEAQPIGDVIRFESDKPTIAARLWIARAGGWRVESAFDLVGGWDPALDGRPDDEYDKLLSSDFGLYENVYRRWVLNEDGFFSAPPYNRGPAFGLAAFFHDASVAPQPLTFQSNLTLTDGGAPVKPIIQFSTNSGAGWSIFTGAAKILSDRAGVYLDTTTLPVAFLAAAKAGTARLRVTASLIDPNPVEFRRWHGNAAIGKLPPNVLDVADVFRFQRVDAKSVHYPGVRSGLLPADEADDSNRMFRWLIDRMTRLNAYAPSGGRATLELAGVWPALRPGDRLLDVGGPGLTADGSAQALSTLGASIRSVETRFAHHPRNERSTRVGLVF